MEREFRIRAEIIFGGAETAPSANASTAGAESYAASGTGADASSRNASHERGVVGDDKVPRYTVVSYGYSNESAEEGQRVAAAAPDEDSDGRAAENDEASGADGRTGWEIEREAFFSTRHQTAQTETAALGWFYCDSPTAAALLLLWWGVDTVWNGFSLLNL